MNEPCDALLRDLQGSRYLEALTAGDLETVAALWDQASCDPDLERLLVELDATLYEEHRTADGMHIAGRESRIRRKRSLLGRHRPVAWWGVASALAAACVLVMCSWCWHRGTIPITVSGLAEHGPASGPRLSWVEAHRMADGSEQAAFHWPLPQPAPVPLKNALSPDVLD
jgi:hypothetical protein